MRTLIVNRAGNSIQLLIWDRDIMEAMKKVLKPGNIVHLDGLSVRTRNSTYSSSSSVPYDLVIGNNTVARIIKEASEYNPPANARRETVGTLSSLEDVLKVNGVVGK